MENYLTIAELVKKGTLSAEMAGFLWSAVDDRVSFLTSALYQNSGKSTLSRALLSLRSAGTALHNVPGSVELMEKLLKLEKRGGYLVVEEFSPAPVAGYIWGKEVRAVFDKLNSGYSLAACIHAKNAEDALSRLTLECGIGDVDASAVKMVLYIEMFGTSLANAARRLKSIYEVHYVENGKPVGHPIYSWNEKSDTFEKVSQAHGFARDGKKLSARVSVIRSLVALGKTSPDDITSALEDFRKSGL